MKKIAISTAVAIAGLALSIVVGVYAESVTVGTFFGVLTGITVLVIGMLVDIRLNQARLPADPDSLVVSYTKLKHGPCELARVVADSKYKEISSFFAELLTGRITLADLNDVYTILKPLFCDISGVKEIHATSHGELTEWLETESWWGKNYMDMNAKAVRRGVKVKRLFILNGEEEFALGVPLFRKNLENHVSLRTALKQTVSPADFSLASNCLIFYDGAKKPTYCLQAVHSRDGGFVSAFLYSDPEHLRAMTEAYGRIEAVSRPAMLP